MARTLWQAPTWDRLCAYCGARLLRGEEISFCCQKGRKVVPALPALPQNISSIAAEQPGQISNLSRRINNLFCFTAIGATSGFQHWQTFQGSVAITGRMYHRVLDVSTPNHSMHWFLYDERERETAGLQWSVNSDWTRAVKEDLDTFNPYVHHLRRFHEHPSEATTRLELSDVSTGGDFAAIMHANNSTQVRPRSILIWRNSESEPTFVPIFSRHYEPLQYPLLFPHGTLGWGLSSNPDNPDHLIRSTELTQREWYKGRLLTDDRFLTFGRLTSEYLCDMYSRIEEERLQFIRRGRLSHILEQDPDADTSTVDIKLPTSFLGSRSWASEETADSLAIARAFGRPSFFITMTFNADWPELRSRLKPGQSAFDVPVLVARVFKQRLKRLLDLIRHKFGHLIYMIKVIEFQKRGYPHAHIVCKVSAPSPKYCNSIS